MIMTLINSNENNDM